MGEAVPLTTSPANEPISASAIAEIMERIAQLSYAQGMAEGLRPAQWGALRYFAQAEDHARTVGRFARHNMITAGSASQTIETLVRRGLLERVPQANDRRSYRLDLTEDGHHHLQQDPIRKLVAAVEQLDNADSSQLASTLVRIVEHMLGGRLTIDRSG